MTDYTQDMLDELSNIIGGFNINAGAFVEMKALIDRERAKLKPVWVLPEKHDIYTIGSDGKSEPTDDTLHDARYKLEIMYSLWLAYGDKYGFTTGYSNYSPAYDYDRESFRWEIHHIMEKPLIHYYSKEIPEVLQHLNEHRELLIK